ncbi:hypothetical protein CIHG_09901 [Coccidioides immitis H538.4]|uniref:Uncharacterized protein n=1 Tax=Coccidioides immitis H538.4 TaxID=396776 RepID=A0A0J8UVY5_COCIT|nr:hypothetical protein CIHG_09901 [Coccidioides immitis H538.4]
MSSQYHVIVDQTVSAWQGLEGPLSPIRWRSTPQSTRCIRSHPKSDVADRAVETDKTPPEKFMQANIKSQEGAKPVLRKTKSPIGVETIMKPPTLDTLVFPKEFGHICRMPKCFPEFSKLKTVLLIQKKTEEKKLNYEERR